MFRRLHFALIGLIVIVASIAAFGALAIVDRAVQQVAKAQIEAEYQELTRYESNFKIVSIADAIDFRVAAGTQHPTLYLLARANGSLVVGSLPEWPMDVPQQPGWYRFSLNQSGHASAEALAKVAVFDDEFPVLVARPMAVYNSLKNDFLPVLLGSILLLAALLLALVFRSHRELNQRVAAINSVLIQAGQGKLSARLDNSATDRGDELAYLARQVNDTLTENTRLMHGLESVSQTAAHEINKELSFLRDAAIARNQTELAAYADNLLRLLREILELSKIESSADTLMQHQDLGDIVVAATALYQDAYDDAGIQLETIIKPALVLGQPHLLTNAVANLLSNALRHAPPASRVLVSLDTEGSNACISVTDEGPGTPSNDLRAILEQSRSGAAAGYGFGLRFVQAVAVRHGAKLELKNFQPGLQVSITFPIAKP